MESLPNEKDRLETLAVNFSSEDGFNARLIDYGFITMQPFLEGASTCLELGCADGRMTQKLVQLFPDMTAVDASSMYIREIQRRLPGVRAVNALFEEFIAPHSYDVIIMSHILEHVQDPADLLARAKTWLSDGGRIIITVPHAESLHRQAGLIMGLISSITELSDADRRIGHRRYYTQSTLLGDVEAAGLKPEYVSGIYLKPLSNAQIEQQWSQHLMDAYYQLGKVYPAMASELFVVATAV